MGNTLQDAKIIKYVNVMRKIRHFSIFLWRNIGVNKAYVATDKFSMTSRNIL